jgi:hypothetical protein
MLFTEIITVYFENYTKLINILCQQSVCFFNIYVEAFSTLSSLCFLYPYRHDCIANMLLRVTQNFKIQNW